MAKRKKSVEDNKKEFIYAKELEGLILMLVSVLGFGKFGPVGRIIRNFSVFLFGSWYVIFLIICLVIGICSTLFITQKCYGGLLRLSYTKEIELAEQRGKSIYRKNLYNLNSGLITIKELEREYVRNHKDTFNKPNEYIDSLTQQINQMKNSNWYKDE